ncbi:MAG TPA: sigma-70 family RNA polymerase sigma factor [Pyrinomonadaceae bacterium]|nr:sigma-70 family RNA polymerase sigma factor [Pyrinomonadaceae bacterium]
MPDKKDVTQLLSKAQAGNREALDELLPLVYDELRRVAGSHLRNERDNHTLQATALVNEAYIRLLEQKEVDWQNRLHFFSIASEMMRRILVNYAVQRNAKKRGDGAIQVELDEAISYTDGRDFDIVSLNDALNTLAKLDEQQAKIVELRFFGGLTIEETAQVLGISDSTVKREWRMAKAWLKTKI